MNLIPHEISMLVSSDSKQGATITDKGGSSFRIELDEGIQIPKDAINPTIALEEATVWWNIPNIITGENNKLYITTPSGGSTQSKTQLGYTASVTFSLNGAGLLYINSGGDDMPTNVFQVNDKFRVDSGALAGLSYTINSVVVDLKENQVFEVTPTNDAQADGPNTFSRIRANSGITDFVLTVPQGLYDPTELNDAIITQMENAGISTETPVFALDDDNSTQRIIIRFTDPNTSIDFTPNDTIRDILGFDAKVYGPYSDVPTNITADFVANFNSVNYFLFHSDLTCKGIPFNNTYSQTLSQILIDVLPGYQITHQPFNPPKVPCDELKGTIRKTLRFWITDENNNYVNTGGEYWTGRVVLRYWTIFAHPAPQIS